MSAKTPLPVKSILPTEAHRMLQVQPDALLVDCRSNAEYIFVGHPGGSVHVPWVDGPDFEPNPHFLGEVRKLAGDIGERPLLLICRSGNRSMDAARALVAAGFSQVYNVTHGFEGDLNDAHQRNTVNGWRIDGLPWEQL